MARTKQLPRKFYKKPVRMVKSYSDDNDDSDSSDYNNQNDYDNNQEDLENEANLEENKDENTDQPTTTAKTSEDYLGPPRKPLNAFYYFKIDEFDATRAANPTLTTLEIIDVIGQKWGDLDNSKRAEYQEKYEKHRNLYEESLKPRVWKPPVISSAPVIQPPEQIIPTKEPEIVKADSRAQKPLPPKRPLTAFFHFLFDMKPVVAQEHPEAKITDITRMISEKWRYLDSETRQTYDARAAEAKLRFEQEVQEYIEKYGPIEKKVRRFARKASDESNEAGSDDEDMRVKPGKVSLTKAKRS